MKKIIVCILILLCLASCSKDEIITTEFDLMLPDFTVGELMNDTSLVVRVKYTGEKESFRIKEANSEGQKNITDMLFDCQEVLYGDFTDKQITVCVDGGNVGEYNEIYNGNPEFVKGREYVLFLYRPRREFNYEPLVERYYIPGTRMGVFEMRADWNEKTTEITLYMHVADAGFTYRDIADFLKKNYG